MSFTERRRRTGRCEFQDNLQVPSYYTHVYLACTFLHACTTRATWLSTFNHYCTSKVLLIILALGGSPCVKEKFDYVRLRVAMNESGWVATPG